VIVQQVDDLADRHAGVVAVQEVKVDHLDA